MRAKVTGTDKQAMHITVFSMTTVTINIIVYVDFPVLVK